MSKLRGLGRLAFRSAWHRRYGLAWVVFSIALSTFLLLTVERLRNDVRESFSNAVSGTDLIVGARTGPVQLLLYSVFHIGQATHNIRYSSLQALEKDKAVAWVVPLSLGDSHRGFPVVATSEAYFEYFRYGEQRRLELEQGRAFSQIFETVIGAEVAARLNYGLGQEVVLRHGDGEIESNDHADKPFKVVGILKRTGMPVDRSIIINLTGMEALHLDWVGGTRLPGHSMHTDHAHEHDLTPKSVTAALVGLKSRAAVFSVQRRVSEFEAEPLLAVLPGIALDELWRAVGTGEKALLVMGALVALVSLAGLIAVVVTALEQRRRELAVLRSLGAGPWRVFILLGLEGALLSVIGATLGLLSWGVFLAIAAPWLQSHYGIGLGWAPPRSRELLWLVSVIVAGTLSSLIPGWRAYRITLSDGLSPRGG